MRKNVGTAPKIEKIRVGDPANVWARVLVGAVEFEAGSLVRGWRGQLAGSWDGLPREWDAVLDSVIVDYAVWSGRHLIAWRTLTGEWFVPDVEYPGRSWAHRARVLWALTTAGEEPVTRVEFSRSEEFFAVNGPTSYRPGEESIEAGRARGARALARAERMAVEAGLSVSWVRDHDAYIPGGADDEVFWLATLVGEAPDGGRLSYTSLGGIEFADGGGPEGNPYARVVGAELAYEWLTGEDYQS